MIEQQVPHPDGTFTPCRRCGREPKHYRLLGYSNRDRAPVDFHTRREARHILECACVPGNKTAPHDYLEEAIDAWNTCGFGVRPDQSQVVRPFPARSANHKDHA